jgi:hypothetical protein
MRSPGRGLRQEISAREHGAAGLAKCGRAEGNVHVEIAGQNYFLSADGFLMPARKDQSPPDLKYFEQPQR